MSKEMSTSESKLRVYDDTKSLFHLPDGVIYLDGNSLGALPLGVAERVSHAITAEWAKQWPSEEVWKLRKRD